MAIPRKPRSFKLEETEKQTSAALHSSPKKTRKPKAAPKNQTITVISDDEANGLLEQLDPAPPHGQKPTGGSGWITLLIGAGLALISLAVGIGLDNLVGQLFERHLWLGWLGAIISIVFCLTIAVLVVKEFRSILRLKKISTIREKSEKARTTDNLRLAGVAVDQLNSLVSTNPSYANARADLKSHVNEVTSGADLIHIAERALFQQADRRATELILNSAKRVSVVTAVSPRAIVDILYVLMENLRLIRTLSQLYGGRPGTWGLLRLSRNVITHLAATGAISIGDGLLQQFVGHGLAAKLSTRLGEGVLNGLLTARIGISAMDICRPMTFHALERPGVGDFMSELVKLNGNSKSAKSE